MWRRALKCSNKVKGQRQQAAAEAVLAWGQKGGMCVLADGAAPDWDDGRPRHARPLLSINHCRHLSKACWKSAQMSSTPSMPQLKRTRLSLMPTCARFSAPWSQ